MNPECDLKDGPEKGIEPDSARGGEGLIPVSLVTGFLGSGKTTLIRRILRDPAMARTAVIVNEFGEIALDHELIARSDDAVLTLTTGCLCCAVQNDLVRTLASLLERRTIGSADYDRVLIETSGLSDPGPILQTMMTDETVFRFYRMTSVITVIDTVHGEDALDEHPEALHQVAVADTLLLSKTDLRSPSDRLIGWLDSLNPSAPRMTTLQVDPARLFNNPYAGASWDRLTVSLNQGRHKDIETFGVLREDALPALVLSLLLQGIAEHCGSRMLRLKGLIAIKEMPGRPAVIHGVKHVMSAPDFLDCWPNEDRRTRIVFIVRGVPRHFVSRLLDAIEEEVLDAAA